MWRRLRKLIPYFNVKTLGYLDKIRGTSSVGDRAQWRRWYQANRKRQRQLTAMKQQFGFFIHPNTTGLLREWVD